MAGATLDREVHSFPSANISIVEAPSLPRDVLNRIASILSLLTHIPKDVHPQCIDTFRLFLQRLKSSGSQHLPDRPRLETVVISCALLVAHSHGIAVSVLDAAAWAKIDLTLLRATHHQIVHVLNHKSAIRHCSPRIFFDRIFQAIRCQDAKVVHVADQILTICLEELIMLGRPSPTIAAAAIIVALRAVYRKALNPNQIVQIECELNAASISSDVDLVLVSLAGLASMLPFDIPFGPDTLDLYLPEIVYGLEQLKSIAQLDTTFARSYGSFTIREVNNRIELAKAVIRICRQFPGLADTSELPIDIYSEQLQIRLGSPRPHLDNSIKALLEKSVSLISILNDEYRLLSN